MNILEREGEREEIARLTLRARIDHIGPTRSWVESLLRAHGLDAAGAYALAKAAGSALETISAHAYEGAEIGTIELAILEEPERLILRVDDRGLPYDYEIGGAEQAPLLPTILSAAEGVAVRARSRGARGNRLELSRRLAGPGHDEALAEAEIERGRAAEPEPDLPEPRLRLAGMDDVVGIVRSLYRAYGYSYADPVVYDAQRVAERIGSGRQRSAVALDAEGEVVGHLAFLAPEGGARVAESGQAVVDTRYRGRGLFQRLKRFLVEDGERRGLRGVFSEAVTVHPYSQKGNLDLGARETGFLLGFSPASVSVKGIAETQRQRQAVCQLYLPVTDAPGQVLHVPTRHRAMAARIYQRLGLPRELAEPRDGVGAQPAAETSEIGLEVVEHHADAFLRVSRIGADLVARLRPQALDLRLHGIRALYLDLPLRDPALPAAADDLEALGFSFASLLPELDGGDVLRLQSLPDVEVDPEPIQTASDFGAELLAFVIEERARAKARAADEA